jgi:PIN domain nuclease of toxin-antitoxin system
MMDYVADAHAIVWHLFAQSRLGKAALAVLDDAAAGNARIYLPAVAVAEMIMVIEKRRIPGVTLSQLEIELELMRNNASYEFLALLPDTVINSHRLTAIPDIFDRLIVAEAVRLGLPLITKDSVITASGLVTVVWD